MNYCHTCESKLRAMGKRAKSEGIELCFACTEMVRKELGPDGKPCYEYEQEYVDDKTIKCEKCGGTYKEGDFPFCKGIQSNHGSMAGFDDAFEPYVDIQLLDRKDPRCTSVNELGIRGVPINSRSERRQLMKELGLQFGTQKFEERGKRMTFDQKIK